MPTDRVTVPAIRSRKAGEKIVCLTAYDAPTGALLDAAGVDVVLVGDSVGMAVLGYDSTLPVTMEEMLHHLRAVRRGVSRALLVADMPFMSYQSGERDALVNAGAFLKAGADAVKLEGGREIIPHVAALAAHGLPVMGHVGLTPQRVREFGGYRAQGRTAGDAARILRAAGELARAGSFSIVLECVPYELARRITADVPVPTIGIGSGPWCDGQILVFHDLVGLTAAPPPFVTPRGAASGEFRRAVESYRDDVRGGAWPGPGGGPVLSDADLAELDRRRHDGSAKA